MTSSIVRMVHNNIEADLFPALKELISLMREMNWELDKAKELEESMERFHDLIDKE